VKNTLINNPEDRRPPGRPKPRSQDQVRRDLRRLVKREEETMDRNIQRQRVGESQYLLSHGSSSVFKANYKNV
jgi:hypothetical protein